MNKENHICPVCGFSKLEEPPYDSKGYPTYVVCSCCGYEFGFDDSSNKMTFEEYREKWVDEGFKFFSKEYKPQNWSKSMMLKQLENAKETTWEPRI